MHKFIYVICLATLVMFSGCTKGNVESDTTVVTSAVETVEEIEEETDETVATVNVETEVADSEEIESIEEETETVEEVVSSNTDELDITNEDVIDNEFPDNINESILGAGEWTAEKRAEAAKLETGIAVEDLTEDVHFEKGETNLSVFTANDNSETIILYMGSNAEIDMLYKNDGSVKIYNSETTTFAEYQTFENLLFVEGYNDKSYIPFTPVTTWYVTEEGDIVELLSILDFDMPVEESLIYKTEVDGKVVLGIIDYAETGKVIMKPITMENGKVVFANADIIVG